MKFARIALAAAFALPCGTAVRAGRVSDEVRDDGSAVPAGWRHRHRRALDCAEALQKMGANRRRRQQAGRGRHDRRRIRVARQARRIHDHDGQRASRRDQPVVVQEAVRTTPTPRSCRSASSPSCRSCCSSIRSLATHDDQGVHRARESRNPPNSRTAARATAAPRISRHRCSRTRREPSSCTFLTRAAAPRCRTSWAAYVNLTFLTVLESGSAIKSGKVRPIAVTSGTRSPALPNVPTIAESGVPDYFSISWIGLLAPAGTPKAIVDKISKDVQEIVASPDMQKRFIEQGATPVGGTPAQFQSLIDSETQRYRRSSSRRTSPPRKSDIAMKKQQSHQWRVDRGRHRHAGHQSFEHVRRRRRVRAGRSRAGRDGDRRRAQGVSEVVAGQHAAARRHPRPDRQRDPRPQGGARHPALARGRQDRARRHRRGRARGLHLQVLRRAKRCARNGELVPSVRPGIEVEITREPVGVVGMITPWNFPIAIPAWKIAPALAFGNCVVFKPADLVPGCAWALAEIISRTALPPGVFNLVMGRGSVVGDAIVTSPDVDAISFTGSVPTGKIDRPQAAIETMKKLQLEMGGKNPQVVLDDAEPRRRGQRRRIQSAYFSTGQRCTASSRLIVTEGIHDRFVERDDRADEDAQDRRRAEGGDRHRAGRRPEPARPGPGVHRASRRTKAASSRPAASGSSATRRASTSRRR